MDKRTLAYTDRQRTRPGSLDETAVAPPSQTTLARQTSVRSTVLPRVECSQNGPRVVLEGKTRYEALRALGSGGQADVMLTHDHDIDREVALKRLRPDRQDDASVLRFTEEIRTVGRLEHPNIVPIHDVGVDEEGHYFFVMKKVEGETLEAIITRLQAGDEAYLSRYTPEYRLQICNEILRGVEHAHEHGVLHRDLKPANIMVGPLGEVVIMDWGLAKRMGHAEEPEGVFIGTPAYMAPEQAAGRHESVDARSDVYSLAVVFYEFLSLRHPRRHCGTVAETIASVIHEPVKTLQVLADFGEGGAPTALAHFVRHGLENDPQKRYASVAAMRARLEAVRDGKAPVECHVTFAQRILDGTSRSVNRHPYVLALVLATLGLGTVGGLVAGALAIVR
jgi:serine/threonine-protein kinase